MQRIHRRWSGCCGIAFLAASGSGCGQSNIAPERLGTALAMTFVNLVGVQESRLGHASVDVHAFGATAACKRLGPGRDAAGSGSWTCTVTWSVPGRKRSLRDTYDLSVTADGCFTATADSAEAHVGGPSLTTPDGRTLPNLLYVFDGCFDTT